MSANLGLVRVLDLPEEDRPRFLKDAHGVREKVRAVGNASGLTRMGVWLRTVQPGDAGTPRHFHELEEEWVYILSGTAEARVGAARFAASAGDFLGYPAGGPAHVLEAKTDLEYLMGGIIDDDDIITYPEAGLVMHHDTIPPIR